MCYNCGCGDPKADHGKGHMGVDPGGMAITDKSFQAAGQAFNQSLQETRENTEELLAEVNMEEDA